MKEVIEDRDNKTASYLLEGVTGSILTEDEIRKFRSFLITQNIYISATREIETKLRNLNEEFTYTKERNPIHQIITRIKSPISIVNKLIGMGYNLSVESARENLDKTSMIFYNEGAA